MEAAQVRPSIEKILNRDPEEAKVEIVFAKPMWRRWILGYLSSNPYGHIGVMYSIPGEMNKVMNISGRGKLINFHDPDKYLFSSEEGTEQGGIAKRSFIVTRMENVDKDQVRKLDEVYRHLEERGEVGDIRFNLFFHTITNPIRRLFGWPPVGNCSYWTSQGLAEAGIIMEKSSFPLLLWFKVFMRQYMANPDDLNVVEYQSNKEEIDGSLIYPLYWLKYSYDVIWNLRRLANIIVTHDDEMKFHIRTNDRAPKNWKRVATHLKRICKYL